MSHESQNPNQNSAQTPETSPVGPPPAPGETPVLQKLSTPPFPRSGFPLLGILASVYEHVTAVAAKMREHRR